MFLLGAPRIFKIAMRASVVKPLVTVACEISAFLGYAKNSITWSLVCFEK